MWASLGANRKQGWVVGRAVCLLVSQLLAGGGWPKVSGQLNKPNKNGVPQQLPYNIHKAALIGKNLPEAVIIVQWKHHRSKENGTEKAFTILYNYALFLYKHDALCPFNSLCNIMAANLLYCLTVHKAAWLWVNCRQGGMRTAAG